MEYRNDRMIGNNSMSPFIDNSEDYLDVETELVFSHADLFPEHECSGEFHKRVYFEKETMIDFIYCCDECNSLFSIDELKKQADSVYQNWESICTRTKEEA